MKKFKMVVRFVGAEEIREHIFQAHTRVGLNLVTAKFAFTHKVLSLDTYNQKTGELVDHVDMGEIGKGIEDMCKRAGFELPSEDDHMLMMASATSEEILGIIKHEMREYRRTKSIVHQAAVGVGYETLKERGIRDQEIEDFHKKYNLTNRLSVLRDKARRDEASEDVS
jgi:hypothetical protein